MDELKLSKVEKKYIARTAIRSSYYIFCRKNKPWTDPANLEISISLVVSSRISAYKQ